ncbi:hypothetical protein FFLO_01095 [Filobasidium floriforme]|uniref:Uncharacterized protein n=1 Tax=Filobasidium floriforme TaxID=5210 RepID=A0A8K0NT08_9TREE|nr:uncharacterized protein HD553DRAFT_311088 [Filobasidium floriforme]KAG7571001.1 hypothetical protein FFLO_01095 [Filobasidium floriforme]KAH8085349.1 hypothetical protein HD553DRAFT_311088 [Filobasidium floriforme]
MDAAKNAAASAGASIREDGAIGSQFRSDGAIGSIGQSIGGPFDKEGAIGSQFTTDGAIGGTAEIVGENISGAAGSATSNPQGSEANRADRLPTE